MKINAAKKYAAVLHKLRKARDVFWLAVFVSGMAFIFVWNLFFLNGEAFSDWLGAVFYTYSVAFAAAAIAFFVAWRIALFYETAKSAGKTETIFAIGLLLDALKSLPQIIVLLLGYSVMIFYLKNSGVAQFVWLAFVLALAFVNDVFEEMRSRVEFFRKSDFYDAMLVAGVKEKRIINRDILARNSLAHLTNRAIIIFSSSVFLLCSVDFIISVGLSSQLSLSGLPKTLGNILANAASKEDILAVRELFANPLYLKEIFTTHLQGVSAGLTLVFTLVSAFKISNGLIERKKLNR